MLPLGAFVAVRPFPGRTVLITVARAGMAVPTVFLGLLCYSLFRSQGPLGPLQLLYTPWAIVVGQLLLAMPIVFSMSHGAVSSLDPRADETIRTLGARGIRRGWTLLSEARTGVLLAILTALGRCITELGIAVMVGGNIAGRTRTLSTATALETSRGEFERGIAMGLLLLLMALGMFVVLVMLARERRQGTSS